MSICMFVRLTYVKWVFSETIWHIQLRLSIVIKGIGPNIYHKLELKDIRQKILKGVFDIQKLFIQLRRTSLERASCRDLKTFFLEL